MEHEIKQNPDRTWRIIETDGTEYWDVADGFETKKTAQIWLIENTYNVFVHRTETGGLLYNHDKTAETGWLPIPENWFS